MPHQKTAKTDSTVHVIPGKTSWVVTRIAPQFNATFHDSDSAVVHARELAQRDGALLLVHRPSGEVETRENYRVATPEFQSTVPGA